MFLTTSAILYTRPLYTHTRATASVQPKPLLEVLKISNPTHVSPTKTHTILEIQIKLLKLSLPSLKKNIKMTVSNLEFSTNDTPKHQTNAPPHPSLSNHKFKSCFALSNVYKEIGCQQEMKFLFHTSVPNSGHN